MWGSAFTIFGEMDELDRTVRRHTFRWPGAARDLLNAYLTASESRTSGNDSQVALKAPDYQNCCRFGKSSNRVLAIRSSGGC
jgi:hypothetical protein